LAPRHHPGIEAVDDGAQAQEVEVAVGLDLQNAHVTRYSNDPLDTAAILRTRRRPAVPLGVERTVPVDAPVGVRTEVVALALREVGRQPGAAIGVVVGQRDTRRR